MLRSIALLFKSIFLPLLYQARDLVIVESLEALFHLHSYLSFLSFLPGDSLLAYYSCL